MSSPPNALYTNTSLTPGRISYSTSPFAVASSDIVIVNDTTVSNVGQVCADSVILDFENGTVTGSVSVDPIPPNILVASPALVQETLLVSSGPYSETSTRISVSDDNKTTLNGVTHVTYGFTDIDLLHGTLSGFTLRHPSNNITASAKLCQGTVSVSTGPNQTGSSKISARLGELKGITKIIGNDCTRILDITYGSMPGFAVGPGSVPTHNVVAASRFGDRKLITASGQYTERTIGIGVDGHNRLTDVSVLTGGAVTVSFVNGTIHGITEFSATGLPRNVVTGSLDPDTLPVCSDNLTLMSSSLFCKFSKIGLVSKLVSRNGCTYIDFDKGELVGFSAPLDIVTTEPFTLVHSLVTVGSRCNIQVTDRSLVNCSVLSGKRLTINLDTGWIFGGGLLGEVKARPSMKPKALTKVTGQDLISASPVLVSPTGDLRNLTCIYGQGCRVDFARRKLVGFTHPNPVSASPASRKPTEHRPLPPNALCYDTPLASCSLLIGNRNEIQSIPVYSPMTGSLFGPTRLSSADDRCYVDLTNRRLVGFMNGPGQTVTNAEGGGFRLLDESTKKMVNVSGGTRIACTKTDNNTVVIDWVPSTPYVNGSGEPVLVSSTIRDILGGSSVFIDDTSSPGELIINMSPCPEPNTGTRIPLYDTVKKQTVGIAPGTYVTVKQLDAHTLLISDTVKSSGLGMKLLNKGVFSGLVAGSNMELQSYGNTLTLAYGSPLVPVWKNSGNGCPLLSSSGSSLSGLEPGHGVRFTVCGKSLVIASDPDATGNVTAEGNLGARKLITGTGRHSLTQTKDCSALFNPLTDREDGLSVGSLVFRLKLPDGNTVNRKLFPPAVITKRMTGSNLDWLLYNYYALYAPVRTGYVPSFISYDTETRMSRTISSKWLDVLFETGDDYDYIPINLTRVKIEDEPVSGLPVRTTPVKTRSAFWDFTRPVSLTYRVTGKSGKLNRPLRCQVWATGIIRCCDDSYNPPSAGIFRQDAQWWQGTDMSRVVMSVDCKFPKSFGSSSDLVVSCNGVPYGHTKHVGPDWPRMFMSGEYTNRLATASADLVASLFTYVSEEAARSAYVNIVNPVWLEIDGSALPDGLSDDGCIGTHSASEGYQSIGNIVAGFVSLLSVSVSVFELVAAVALPSTVMTPMYAIDLSNIRPTTVTLNPGDQVMIGIHCEDTERSVISDIWTHNLALHMRPLYYV